MGQQDQEFLAPIAKCRAAGIHVLRQQRGYVLKHPVTRGVAETVIDLLEMVDIEQQHRQRASGLGAAVKFALQGVVEIAAVVQPGEGVTVGLLLKLCLQRLDRLELTLQRQFALSQLVARLAQRDCPPIGAASKQQQVDGRTGHAQGRHRH